jgi:DNA-directed RNA polymerase sigma subunit (sigma70/sigma32)
MRQEAKSRLNELSLTNEQKSKIKELEKIYPEKNSVSYYEKLAVILFGTPEGLTLDEIGMVLGITRERVRQIYDMTLKKLQSPRFSASLRKYLNI